MSCKGLVGGECLVGSLSGVVGWKRVREGCKGGVRRIGKGGESVMG